MQVRDIEQFLRNKVDPLVGADLAAYRPSSFGTGRRTKPGLATKRYDAFVAASRTHVARVAGLRVAAAHHLLDSLADVCALSGRDVFFVEVEPAVPMVDEDLAKAVASVSGLWMEKHVRRNSEPSTNVEARNEPDEALFRWSIAAYNKLDRAVIPGKN